MWLVVGLGNPGEKYQNTRHNLGFELVEDLRRKLNGPDWEFNKKFNVEISKLSEELILIRPQTFMNDSGIAVSKMASFFKIQPEEIVIVHDELDIPLGHIKVSLGGGANGHHGVESVIEKLGTDQFIRVRLGMGHEKSHSAEHKRINFSAERFVLDKFLSNEISDVKKIFKKGVLAIETLFKDGLDKTQNQFN